MVNPNPSGFTEEMRIDLTPLQIGTFLFAALFGITFGRKSDLDIILPIALLLLTAALASVFLRENHPHASAWTLFISLIVSIPLIYHWSQNPILLSFLAVPVIAATFAVNPRAGFWVALLASAALGVLALLFPASRLDFAGALLGIWAIFSLVWWMNRRASNVAYWSWEHYQQAIAMLEETRTHRAELMQMTLDLKHANQQMVMMNKRLDAARQAAEEAQKAKASFVANVSHEFRTPLNMIIGLTDLLVETPEIYGGRLPDALLEDLDIVRRNSEHLSTMINDVLDLSQVEAGRLALNKERVNVLEIIQKAFVVVKPLISRKALTAAISAPEDLPEVYCDRNRIRQVIVNLLSNAARCTEKGGITVKVAQNSGNLVVSVSDTGPGIAPDVAARLFQPFSQGEKSNDSRGESQKTSGLGLTISKEFVTLHGGQMWLESEVGSGSTFHFSLPITGPLQPVINPGGQIVESWQWMQRDTPANLSLEPARPLILLYDETGDLGPLYNRYADGAVIRALPSLDLLIAEAHQSPAQYVVINAANPDVLPGMVSSACQALPDLPVYGCSFPHRAARALEAGAIGYLMKPTTRSALIDALGWVNTPVQSILIVDDILDELTLFRRILTSWNPDLIVETAASCQEALQKMALRPGGHPFDLVFLDIILPDGSGWELLEKKKTDPDILDIPVIILSGIDPDTHPYENHLLVASMGNGMSLQETIRSFRNLTGILTKTV